MVILLKVTACMLLMGLISFPSYATDARFKACLEQFPQEINLLDSVDELSHPVEKKQITDYEVKIPGMGYGVYYQGRLVIKNDLNGEVGPMCQISFFVYSAEMNPETKMIPLSREAQVEHLILSTAALGETSGRTRKKLDSMTNNIPENAQLMALFSETTVDDMSFVVATSLYENETERILIGSYQKHYLKTLLTCDSLGDIEADKKYMSIITPNFMEEAVHALKKCQ